MNEQAFRSVCEAQIKGMDHARFMSHMQVGSKITSYPNVSYFILYIFTLVIVGCKSKLTNQSDSFKIY